MTPKILFVASLIFVGHTAPLIAADMTLIRQSRPVTAAGGAPTGGMVYDFFATSSADVLCIGTSFSMSVYKHPYATDYETPDPELIDMYPAVGASSFLKTPGSTFKLGGGLNSGATEKVWGDLENNGPQTQYQFGRLAMSQTGAFAGSFFLRGDSTYIEMPFSFTLPGPTGPLTEEIVLSGVEQIYFSPPPATPTSEPTTDPSEWALGDVDSGIGVSPATQAWLNSPRPKLSLFDINALKTAQLNRAHPAALAAQQIPEPSGVALGTAAVLLLSRWRPWFAIGAHRKDC